MRHKVGYVVGAFPNLTETFVLREIEALGRHGIDIAVFAVKRPTCTTIEQSVGDPKVAEQCTYARPDQIGRHLWENLKAVVLHPRRYLAAFWLILQEAPRLAPPEFARLVYHFLCGVGFCRELRRRGVTHLHAHFTAATNVALAAHLYDGVPFSFTAHASGDIFMNPVLLPLKVERARFVTPVCDYSKRYVDSLTGYRFSAKFHRIYNGVAATEPDRILGPFQRTAPLRDSGDLRIVSVGSLVGVKGHDVLIAACGVLKRRGVRVECCIIGEGPEREVLQRLLISEKVEDRVRLLGAVPLQRIYESLRQADVFALLCQVSTNGYRDGLPTAVLEAMAVGLPILSTWMSGIPEEVIHLETGILVPERDLTAVVEAIELFIREPARRRQMGEAGRLRLRQVFDPEVAAAQRAGLLRQALIDAASERSLLRAKSAGRRVRQQSESELV